MKLTLSVIIMDSIKNLIQILFSFLDGFREEIPVNDLVILEPGVLRSGD